jgi:hypothetical protein
VSEMPPALSHPDKQKPAPRKIRTKMSYSTQPSLSLLSDSRPNHANAKANHLASLI